MAFNTQSTMTVLLGRTLAGNGMAFNAQSPMTVMSERTLAGNGMETVF